MEDYMAKYESWLSSDYFDENDKEELRKIASDKKEIQERFYKELEFGTAGLRGIIGMGTNRMNKYIVGKATQGLANYILKQPGAAEKGVAIAFDSRNMSDEFAHTAALVLSANKIKAYIYPELRPVPVLSFTIRHLGCTAGIVVTASHNPAKYNGYKVYWEDGGQVPSPRDGEIMKEVNAVNITEVKKVSLEEAKKSGYYIELGPELDDAYIAAIKKLSLNGDIIRKMADNFKIVYTPLHGSGNKPVRRILQEVGFKHVYVVPEQEKPDGNFPTVNFPNPEFKDSFNLAIELAKKVDADIIVATDPDADRVGGVVKTHDGDYAVLTGNISGSLLTEYVLSQRKAKGLLSKNPGVVKTIVTTDMVKPMCEAYGAKLFDVLTGFKYIGNKIKEWEKTGEYTYEFGFEESYGSLAGTYARDKDAVAATMLLCELAAVLKDQGKTLYEGLLDLYEKYGYYREGIKSITLEGIEGLERIAYIMETLRKNPPCSLAGKKVEWLCDFKEKEFKNLITGETETNDLPSSNVLRYKLEGGAWVCVRPSGTEPKLKIYYGIKGASLAEAEAEVKKLESFMGEYVEKL